MQKIPEMTFEEYQKRAIACALPACKSRIYMTLGLTNEAGEVAGKIKKVLRGDSTIEESLQAISDEIGDTIWYAAGLASELNISLLEIVENNIKKLESRKERGKLQGDGDQR